MSEHSLDTHHEDDKAFWVAQLQGKLMLARSLREAAQSRAPHAQARLALRAWQSERLARTYADLLDSERYAPAASFFLQELYGTHDATERDNEVERIMPTLEKLLPASGLRVLAHALEMDALSETLDNAMLAQLGHDTALDAVRYARAYRDCNNPAERARQIWLMSEIGHTLDHLTQKPLLGLSLQMMAGPAKLAGLADLHRFLSRGYQSFRHMQGATDFLATIAARETALMETLFSGGSDGL